MSESKHYFQLIHTDEDGSKTYRIHLPPDRVRRCARCGRWVIRGNSHEHNTQTPNQAHRT